jgi:putative glycosyltransferase wbgP
MIKISCIIPAFNEEKNIEKILSVVSYFLNSEIYEIIVIDDFSSDKTVEVIEKNYPFIKLIKNSRNL